MELVPLDDRIVVQIHEAKTKTGGGLHLPTASKMPPKMGKVIAIGDGKLLDNGERSIMKIKVGDTILFGLHSGEAVEIEEKKYRIFRESDILAIVKD